MKIFDRSQRLVALWAVFFGIGILGMSPSLLAASATAFSAAQALAKLRGPAVAQSICRVEGVHGGPQPTSWTFVLKDLRSRSGFREIVISGQEVTSDSTPLSKDYFRGYGAMLLPELAIAHLKLDSDQVFQKVNAQAIEAGIGFHWVDYSLFRNAQGAFWDVKLFDYSGMLLGNMQFSADQGTMVQGLILTPEARRAPSLRQSKWVREGGLVGHIFGAKKEAVDSTKQAKATAVTALQQTKQFATDTVHKTKRSILHVTGDVQEWLTGKRTVDRDQEGDH